MVVPRDWKGFGSLSIIPTGIGCEAALATQASMGGCGVGEWLQTFDPLRLRFKTEGKMTDPISTYRG